MSQNMEFTTDAARVQIETNSEMEFRRLRGPTREEAIDAAVDEFQDYIECGDFGDPQERDIDVLTSGENESEYGWECDVALVRWSKSTSCRPTTFGDGR